MIVKVIKGCKTYLKMLLCVIVGEELGRLREDMQEATRSEF